MTLTFLFDSRYVNGVERLTGAAPNVEHVLTELARQPRQRSRHEAEGGASLHGSVADTADGQQRRRAVGADDRLKQNAVRVGQMPYQLSLGAKLLRTSQCYFH